MLGGEAAPEPDFSSGLPGNGGVWSFDAGPRRWTAIASSIPNALDTSVTYDVWAHRIIAFVSFRSDPQSQNVFGPIDFISETWAYDPVTGVWENRHPAQAPPAGLLAGGSQIAYNTRWGKTIMFGGLDLVLFEKYLEGCGPAFNTCDNSLLPLIETNHTWVYDYFANMPRAYGRITYNWELDRVVLFGGVDYTETIIYGDTWTFNYWDQTWTLRHPATSPSPRGWFSMAYSPEANAVTIFGGGVDRLHFTDETRLYLLAPDKWVQVP